MRNKWMMDKEEYQTCWQEGWRCSESSEGLAPAGKALKAVMVVVAVVVVVVVAVAMLWWWRWLWL